MQEIESKNGCVWVLFYWWVLFRVTSIQLNLYPNIMFMQISTLLFFITGNEQLNKETLDKVIHEADILRPDWGKIANPLGFKLSTQGQITASIFLEEWHTYARNSQPSWKRLSWALGNIKDYKPMVKKIQGNDGMCVYLNLDLTKN